MRSRCKADHGAQVTSCQSFLKEVPLGGGEVEFEVDAKLAVFHVHPCYP